MRLIQTLLHLNILSRSENHSIHRQLVNWLSSLVVLQILLHTIGDNLPEVLYTCSLWNEGMTWNSQAPASIMLFLSINKSTPSCDHRGTPLWAIAPISHTIPRTSSDKAPHEAYKLEIQSQWQSNPIRLTGCWGGGLNNDFCHIWWVFSFSRRLRGIFSGECWFMRAG